MSMLKVHDASASPLDDETLPISSQEFALFRDLILNEAGISLTEAKKALLVCRLQKRLRVLSMRTFSHYYDYIKNTNKDELVLMLDCICTNETDFFREPEQFDFLANVAAARWREGNAHQGRSKQLRIWSAACSTGEEPFSIAMVLLDALPPSAGWDISILASDLSTQVLARAAQATWPIDKAKKIPERYLKKFMLQGVGSQHGIAKADSKLRSHIKFARINLALDNHPITYLFDAIFCRNVLIYFTPKDRARVLHRLAQQLRPGGYLFLGHAESLAPEANLTRVGASIYVRS